MQGNKGVAKKRWTRKEIRCLKDFWPTLGSKGVAGKIDRPWRAVQRKAVRMGIESDREARYLRASETQCEQNESCDTEYFVRGWNSNMAYILGYIYADGSIQKNLYGLNFLCHTKDEEILLAIHDELKSEHKIHRKDACISPKGRKNGPRTYFNLTSKKLVMSLIEGFGLQPRKTWLDLPLPEMPDEFFGHFLRGYFDGDGHIHSRKNCNGGSFNIVGTRKFLIGIRRTLCRLIGVRKVKLQKPGAIFALEWGYHADLKSIYRLMYPKGEEYIRLGRKYKVFKRVFKQQVLEKGPAGVRWK